MKTALEAHQHRKINDSELMKNLIASYQKLKKCKDYETALHHKQVNQSCQLHITNMVFEHENKNKSVHAFNF